jgi:hypothetical protein
MPHVSAEIINIFKSKGRYFCVVKHTLDGKTHFLRFGTSCAGHTALQKMFEFRPFDQMPGLHYRYFIRNYGAGNTENGNLAMIIHVVQNGQEKSFHLAAPKELISHLLWIARLNKLDDAAPLLIPLEKANTKKVSWMELLRGSLGATRGSGTD